MQCRVPGAVQAILVKQAQHLYLRGPAVRKGKGLTPQEELSSGFPVLADGLGKMEGWDLPMSAL